MGDISSEPSMEEILSSIKRIIAEEGDAAPGSRARRVAAKGGAEKPVAEAPANDEVLELSEPAPDPVPEPEPAPQPLSIGAPDVPPAPETILSDAVAQATRGRLEALSRMVVKPEAAASPAAETLEGLVRELLKPMLREWLDANLPQMVEKMVAREIERITSRSE